jgi:hypothetical protein
MMRKKNGQSMLEYITLIGIVAVVFTTMGVFIQRGAQGMIKMVADQIGVQNEADQQVDDPSDGYLVNTYIVSQSAADKGRQERLGVFNYIYDDNLATQIITVTNEGFQER